ncbi:LuxR C-terminal-related transcriptional regulator [Streptomyces sp. NPDC015661]|uniref:LuxR C-terminal-related transcriptional regulator n=1 Tax=Streptomyces sp. NPDC015661 TaxID=3364961 RepID=UPI0036F532F9
MRAPALPSSASGPAATARCTPTGRQSTTHIHQRSDDPKETAQAERAPKEEITEVAEVAEIATTGLTNQQIARCLFISRRTVGAHP